MGFWADAYNVAVACGEGIVSVGEDLAYGVERTAQGLNFSNPSRQVAIATENELLAKLLADMVKHGINTPKNPLYRVVKLILSEYYQHIPEEILKKLAEKLGLKIAYYGGRMVIGKKIAEKIALKIAAKVALTAAYKQLAKKIGVSAGASATGVGIPISLLMLQGVVQRASKASQRLKKRQPALWLSMRQSGGLDMIYFIVEKPMQPYIDGIAMAKTNAPAFRRRLESLKKELESDQKTGTSTTGR